MTSAIAVMQSPFGVMRALGARLAWGVPGVCGVMAAYSYFPKPTRMDEQNVAGAPLRCCCARMRCCGGHALSGRLGACEQTGWSSAWWVCCAAQRRR
jgi:hypothetical protein